MSDLMVVAGFTKSGVLGPGEPATGLTLSEIDIWLTAVDRATGATTPIWTGAQNATFEVDNVGGYGAIYSGADMDAYNYFASVRYDGVTVLDQNWVNGSVGVSEVPIGTAQELVYVVQDPGANPIEGVKVEIHRNIAGTDVYWVGWTDAFGEPRDIHGHKARLDPGTYYLFRFKGGYSFDNPDTEVVT
jgi:hypothetical protein